MHARLRSVVVDAGGSGVPQPDDRAARGTVAVSASTACCRKLPARTLHRPSPTSDGAIRRRSEARPRRPKSPMLWTSLEFLGASAAITAFEHLAPHPHWGARRFSALEGGRGRPCRLAGSDAAATRSAPRSRTRSRADVLQTRFCQAATLSPNPLRTAPNPPDQRRRGAEAARWEAAARLCYFFHRWRGFAPRPAATDAMAMKENSPMPAPRSAPALDVHARAARDVLYPCSDGRPMADNAWQSRAILRAAGDLEVAHPDALALADILVYPEEGNPRNRIAPDVLVAFGVGTHSRSSYLVWEEGKPPDWVLEVASPSTASKDLDFKRRAYAAMGVPEYWLFDPKGDVFPTRAATVAGADAGRRRVRASGAAARGRRGDDPQRRSGAGSARGRRVHPHARPGDPGGHPASARVEGARRAGDGAAQGRRSPRPDGKQSVRSGKPRIAWPRRLASRSWRPLFSVLKIALFKLAEGRALRRLRAGSSNDQP